MLMRKKKSQAGYSYVEMMVTATVLVVLASIAVPMYKWDQKRRKEAKLRVYLQQMRDAIDLYKRYADEGRILLEDVEQMGYPRDFEDLVEGVTVSDPVFTQGAPVGGTLPGTNLPGSERNRDSGAFSDRSTSPFGETAEGNLHRFLLRIPVDPIAEVAEWGMRSYQDDWDATSWGGENVYDVYSLSDKKALDGTYYRDW